MEEGINTVRTELSKDIESVRTEVAEEFILVRTDISELENKLDNMVSNYK